MRELTIDEMGMVSGGNGGAMTHDVSVFGFISIGVAAGGRLAGAEIGAELGSPGGVAGGLIGAAVGSAFPGAVCRAANAVRNWWNNINAPDWRSWG